MCTDRLGSPETTSSMFSRGSGVSHLFALHTITLHSALFSNDPTVHANEHRRRVRAPELESLQVEGTTESHD